MIYDGLLVLVIFFAMTFCLVVVTGGEAFDSNNLAYKCALVLIGYCYFCWHWVAGRQTLGMRSWHVFLVNRLEQNLTWHQASLRFISALLSLALLGLGFIWSLFDRDQLTLHDRLSKTTLIVRNPQTDKLS